MIENHRVSGSPVAHGTFSCIKFSVLVFHHFCTSKLWVVSEKKNILGVTKFVEQPFLFIENNFSMF